MVKFKSYSGSSPKPSFASSCWSHSRSSLGFILVTVLRPVLRPVLGLILGLVLGLV